MPKFTVREFAKSLGLEETGSDYSAASTMLKMLASKGIAKEVDRINTSAKGRKSVVYEVPDPIVLSVSAVETVVVQEPVVETVAVQEPVVETVVVQEPVVETVVVQEPVVETVMEVVKETTASQEFYYDYGDEDDDIADAA